MLVAIVYSSNGCIMPVKDSIHGCYIVSSIGGNATRSTATLDGISQHELFYVYVDYAKDSLILRTPYSMHHSIMLYIRRMEGGIYGWRAIPPACSWPTVLPHVLFYPYIPILDCVYRAVAIVM